MNDICEPNDNVSGGPGLIPYPMPPMGVRTGDSLFQIAWQGKWFILITALLGLGGAYLYLRTLKPMYTSTSRVLVERPLSQRTAVDILQPGTTAINFLQQQSSIIVSREIVSHALNSPSVRALSSLDDSRLRDVLRTLAARVGKDDVINVTASSEDSDQAAVIVNAVVDEYRNWQAQNRESSAAELLSVLNKDLETTRTGLEKKRREVAAAAERIGIVGTAQGNVASGALDVVQRELATAHLDTAQKESHYNRLVKLESDPNRLRQYVLSQNLGVENGERTRLVDGLHAAQQQLEKFSAGGAVQKSQFALWEKKEKELAQKIAELDKQFAREQIATAKDLWDDAKTREENLKKLHEAELTKLQKASAEDSQYELAKAEYQMLESQHNTLLGKINSLDLNANLGGLTIHILEKAVPGIAAPSQVPKILALGLLLGLVVGSGLALVRDWRDQRVRSAEEITALLGVPILGAVPKLAQHGILHRKAATRFASNSPESEAFRSIRTALLFGPTGGQAKTFLVTSPGPLEGKTTLVSNLGIAMAHAGQKTLIVDADLRKPAQQRIFVKTGHSKGFVDVLAGTTTLEEAIRSTEVPGLDVLESGRAVSNPSELFGNEAFWAIFNQLKERYDQILVDSPPIGLVVDAQILAARCGLTLLVVRAQKSLRVTTQRARNALSIVGARVAGAVVNDVSRKDMRYSHYGSGAYGHYHGYYNLDGSSSLPLKELPAGVGPRPDNGSSNPRKK